MLVAVLDVSNYFDQQRDADGTPEGQQERFGVIIFEPFAKDVAKGCAIGRPDHCCESNEGDESFPWLVGDSRRQGNHGSAARNEPCREKE